jgi:3-oxoacyl-[acyl-carrier protein] reductase
MRLANKVAAITGASGDLGKEILKKFSKEGADIYALVRDEKNETFRKFTKELSLEYKNKISIVHLDLENKDTIKSSFEIIKKENNHIDILINNAGVLENALFQMTSEKILKKIFEINFFSQFFLTQMYLKLLINSKNANVVFVSSNSSTINPIGRVAYSSSKAALNSLAISLSKETGGKNLRVNAVLPGLTNTKMAINYTNKDNIEKYINDISLKRIAEPDEIANVISFLCSDDSSYINGQLISIDGGR